MARTRAMGSLTRVEGCENIEKLLHDSHAIENLIKKCSSLVKAISASDLKDGNTGALDRIRVGLQAGKVLMDLHKMHTGVSTKTLESERSAEDAMIGQDDDSLLAMIAELETKTGQRVIDVEGECIDGDNEEEQEE